MKRRWVNPNNTFVFEDLLDFIDSLHQNLIERDFDTAQRISKLIEAGIQLIKNKGVDLTIEEATRLLSQDAEGTMTPEKEKRMYRYKSIIEAAESYQSQPHYN